MYLPKNLNAYLPSIDIARYNINKTHIPDLSKIFKYAWRDVQQWSFLPKQSGEGYYNYHRSPRYLYGDVGYIRLGAFIGQVLRSTFHGRQIFTMLPTKKRVVKFTHSLGTSDLDLKDYKQPLEKHEDAFGSTSFFLTADVLEAFVYFYSSPAFTSFNANLINVSDIKKHILTLYKASYLENEEDGSTIVNILLHYVKLVWRIWLSEVVLDENGKPKVDGAINVKFKKFNLFDILINEEYKEMFIHYTLSGIHTEIIRHITTLSTIGGDTKVDMNGVSMSDDFFEKLSDGIMESALIISLMYYELSVKVDEFFDLLPEYASIIRLKMLQSDKINIDLKGGREFCIGYQLCDVETAPSELEDKVKFFENAFDTLFEPWVAFVNNFFVPVDDLPNKGLPNIRGLYAELMGVNQIYSLTFSSPYASVTQTMVEYPEGTEYHNILANKTDSSLQRLTKTRIKDDSYKPINSMNMEKLPNDVKHNYFLALLRAKRNILVTKLTPTSTIYKLTYDTVHYVIVPPINPVLDYHFAPEVLPKGITQDYENFVCRAVNEDEITFDMLPFIISAAEYNKAYRQKNPDAELAAMFNKQFSEALRNSYIGPDNYILKVPVGRAVILQLASLVALQNVQQSDKLLKFLAVKIDESSLNVNKQCVLADVPSTIFIPVPYLIQSSTNDQIEEMRKSNDKPLVSIADSKEMLKGQGFTVYLDKNYSIFSDMQKLALCRVKVGRNLILNSSRTIVVHTKKDDKTVKGTAVDVTENVSEEERCYVYKLLSFTENIDLSADSFNILFNKSECDFYDPFKGASAEQASLQLLLGVLTDIILTRASSYGRGQHRDYDMSARTVIDVVNFWKDYFKPTGRVNLNTNYDIDKTWGDLIKIFEPVIPYAEQVYEIGKDTDRDDLTTIQDNFEKHFIEAMKLVRNNASVFWNSYGFEMESLYFGCPYELLADKFCGRSRLDMPQVEFGSINRIMMPEMIPGSKELMRPRVVQNLKVLLFNLICKQLYRSQQ